MKKLAVALTAFAAFTGSAIAADLPAKAPMMAAPIASVPSWTGCYIGAGIGFGMYNNDGYLVTAPPNPVVGTRTNVDLTQGGRGYLGTVGGGCDYQFGFGQFGNRFVVGAFADGDWTHINGSHTGQNTDVGLISGTQTLNSSWAVGGRAGYLITPSLLTYFSGGYTEANMSGVTYQNLAIITGLHINSQNFHGYFLGAGDEYALNFLPGLFWKTEYRFSDFNSKDIPVLSNTTGLPNGVGERTHIYEHSIRSELVYRFNWGGPVVARY
jgi:outer membrane immunogenic protein